MKVLFLTHRLPYTPNRGDRIRAYHLLSHLTRFADVTLVSLAHDAQEAAHAADLQHLVTDVHVVRVAMWRNRLRAVPLLGTDTPLTHVLLDGPGLTTTIERVVARARPSVVFAFCSGMARLASLPCLAHVPLVHDMVDVDSAKWRSLAAEARWPLSAIYAREARTLHQFEAEITRRACHTTVVNARELDLLLSIAPGGRISILSQGVDLAAYSPPQSPADSQTVVFTGVFDYGPNDAAARWLLSAVWPLVRAARPTAELSLVGAGPSPTLREAARSVPGVMLTGTVPDVRPFLWHAAIAVAPIFMSHGIQNKVLEAVAAGLPIVTTTAVREGLPPEVVPACCIADTAEDFAREVVRLLERTPDERRAQALRADLNAIDWSARLSGLEAIVTEAASASPARTR